MPTFYGSGVTVQLSTAELQKAITLKPSPNKCPKASLSIRNIAAEFTRSSIDSTLAEDDIIEEASASRVRYLGKYRDMPFLMVNAGRGFFDNDGGRKRTGRPARVPQIMEPGPSKGRPVSNERAKLSGTGETKDRVNQRKRQSTRSNDLNLRTDEAPESPEPLALCLTVFLSEATFSCLDQLKRAGKKHCALKIDVFFNGQLTESTLVPDRFESDINAMLKHIVRFTGQRYGRTLEKPLIIDPHVGENSHHATTSAPDAAKQRWHAVSANLLKEADGLGRNRRSERPVIGEYLEALAQQQLPTDLEKTAASQFGVIDVVISYGQGAKLGPDSQYMAHPTPLRLLGFGQYAGPDDKQLESSLAKENDSFSRGSQKTSVFDLTLADSGDQAQGTKYLKNYISKTTSLSKDPALSTLEDPEYVAKPKKTARDRLSRESSSLLSDIGTSASEFMAPVPRLRPRRTTTTIPEESDPDTPMKDASPLNRPRTPGPNNFGPPSSPSKSVGTTASTKAARTLIKLRYADNAQQPPALNTSFPFPPRCPPPASTAMSSFQREDTNPFTNTSYAFSPLTPPLSSPTPPLSTRAGPDQWISLKYTSPLRGHSHSTSEDTSPFRVPGRATQTPTPKPESSRVSRKQPSTNISSRATSTPVTESSGSVTLPQRGAVKRSRESVAATTAVHSSENGESQASSIQLAMKHDLDKGFEPGGLNEGCRIGYAERGIMRNVPSVRSGWFREARVVVGVRFIVE